MNIEKYSEKFKKVIIVSDAVDVLDEMFTYEYKKFDEIERILLIFHFFNGLCVGESMSKLNEEDNPIHWFTAFHDTIIDMFLSRHNYYLDPSRTKIFKIPA